MNSELSLTTQVVVATYNPDVKLLEKNLLALSHQFANILVMDDGSSDFAPAEAMVKKLDLKIEILQSNENLGIAHALNVGLKKAIDRPSKWLLTMDQDSIIPENFSAEYEEIADRFSNLGLIGWNQRTFNEKRALIENDWFIISSGCLINTEALNECGGFDDDLFIDHVDTDINIKLRNLGYKTIITNKVRLSHQLGTATNKKTIRGESYRAHSPLRVYYIARNSIALFKRHFFKQPLWTLCLLVIGLKEGIYLLAYQTYKLKNLRLLAKAWFDGTFGRLGKY